MYASFVSEPTFTIEFDVGKATEAAGVSDLVYKLKSAGPKIPVGPVWPVEPVAPVAPVEPVWPL
jgi:hypothetical protein